MKVYILLFSLLILQGCASHTRPSAQPVLLPWQGPALKVQFSARVLPQAAELPLQGGLHISAEGGTLAVILQHGRTLGQCRIEPLPEKQPEKRTDAQDHAPRAAQNPAPPPSLSLRLHCRVAEGLGGSSLPLLTRVAEATYRTLHFLRTQGSPGADGSQPVDWRVTPVTPQALQPLAYEDSLGSVHITFSEIHP